MSLRLLRVETENLEAGMSLALPVFNPRSAHQVLLQRGFELDSWSIRRLRELEITTVWVQYSSLDFLDEYVSPEVMEKHGTVVKEITRTFEAAQKDSVARLPIAAYRRSIGELIASLVENPKAALFMGEMVESGGAAIRHASTVTYLSLLMGLRLEGYLVRQRRHIDPARAGEVTNLGIGAMLHDIGLTKLEGEAREVFEKTGNENEPVCRVHASLGYQLVRGQVEPSAATVVLNHHQRFDGSGYGGESTGPLRGTNIHVFSRIAALADEADRLRFPPNAPPNPAVWALGVLQHPSMVNRFDPATLGALFTVMPAYSPGSMVKLNTDEDAVVIEHVPWDPCRPVVQVITSIKQMTSDQAPALGRTINLSESSNATFITRADGFEVAQFNFARPRFMLGMVGAA